MSKKVMGIIEAIKLITFEEAFEKGFVIGIEIGSQIKTYEVTKNLLRHTDFDTCKIAALVNISESFVEKVRQEILID